MTIGVLRAWTSRMAIRAFPRKRLVLAVCVLTLLMPVAIWWRSVGSPLPYFTHELPPGQSFYVLSKLCALLALVLFWLQCMTALAKYAPVLRGFLHLKPAQHAMLGSATLMLVLLHVGLFILAGSLRTGHSTLSILMPRFDEGFYSAYVSVGAVAVWLLVPAVIAGVLRLRGRPQWCWLHRLGLVVFALAFLHGLAIGSETRFGMMKYLYAFIGLSVTTAVLSWLWWVGVRARSASTHAAPIAVDRRLAQSSE